MNLKMRWLLFKVNIFRHRLDWWNKKKELKDKYLGEWELVVIEVLRDWEESRGLKKYIRSRDIKFYMRRRYCTFIKTKPRAGTQLTDETALPLGLMTHKEACAFVNKIQNTFDNAHHFNERRQAILHPKFPELNKGNK